ncbi:MAG TPA: hybrid sensor histidine kinase/response regulator [Candidatus Omnitrophica bacterium]|nr:hybrid sensor histidine kinase/response regulator [Candidatus Omnitrophota bacterium]
MKDYAIFVVECDKLVEEALKETLSNEGYTVYSFSEPCQALSYISKINFQIAIIDVTTGDIPVENFVSEIKKKTPSPAVIITVYTPDAEEIINLVNKGVDAILLKPINIPDLKNVLSQVENECRIYDQLEKLRNENEKFQKENNVLKENLFKVCVNISMVKLARIFLHELKNYLTTINLSLHNLQKQLPSRERVDKYLQLISRSASEANELAMRILGMRKEKKERVDINRVLKEILEMLNFEFRKQGIRVEASFNELPIVDIDSSALKQVFLNVILNAKEAMPSGGELKIKTDCLQADSSYILIEIQDSGQGISKENMEKIFLPGFTTKSDGTGIGLYVTKSITEKLGGKIEVESKLGRGTKFRILLPVKAEKFSMINE